MSTEGLRWALEALLIMSTAVACGSRVVGEPERARDIRYTPPRGSLSFHRHTFTCCERWERTEQKVYRYYREKRGMETWRGAAKSEA